MNDRDRFEAWYLDFAPCPGDESLAKAGGAYVDETTALLWACWQAAIGTKP